MYRKPALVGLAALVGASLLVGPTAFAADPTDPPGTPAAGETPTPTPSAEAAPSTTAAPTTEPAAPSTTAAPTATTEASPSATTELPPTPDPTPTPTSEPTPTGEAEDEPGADALVAGPSEIGTVTRDECTLSIPVTIGDDGATALTVWDDNAEIARYPLSDADSMTVTHTITATFGAGSPGLGLIVVNTDGESVSEIDPYDFENSAQISQACEASGGTEDGIDDDTPTPTPEPTPTPTPEPTPTQPADVASDLLIDDISRDKCVISIPVRVGTEDDLSLAIWDDGTQIGDVDVSGPVGEVSTFTYRITKPFLQGAPGVAIILNGDDGSIDGIDEWDFPGSSEVAEACGATGGKSDVLPVKKPVKQPGKTPKGLPATGN